jgi:ankyrin repeat protein
MISVLNYHGEKINQVSFTKVGKKAIHIACENGHQAIVELLIQQGADKECRTLYTVCASR